VTVDTAYGASQITVLKGLEAVRKRPGMYIGSVDERGLHHLVHEVVDNSVDEAMAGHATGIDVTLLADGGVRVIDDGRGIPVEMHPTEGLPTIEVVMTILHAGGKFEGDGYKVSGGLHGVGISVVNALSRRVEARVWRDSQVHDIAFVQGGRTEGTLTSQAQVAAAGVSSDSPRTGTQITFWADPTIFETTTYVFDTLAKRFQEMAFLNKGLRITLNDDREVDADGTVKTITFQYEGGIADFVSHLNANKRPIHPDVILIETDGEEMAADIALQWNDSYSESILSFANTINTREGGTHEEGFRTALTGLINRYAREKGLIKEKDDNLSGEDVREGLTAVISIKIGDPTFEGQTKGKLGNSSARAFVLRALTDGLSDWLDRNPGQAKDIITKAQQSAKARDAARKARDTVRRKTGLSGAAMPGKLSDCITKDPARAEVYVVEGDSAGGSAKSGRDPQTQAILPIRGKILNVERARIDKALANNEVQAIITALGCGLGEEFDVTKLRYHKIVLMADADVDGQHITTLLLTLLYRYMRPVVDGGFVYLSQPPLYKIKWDRDGKDSSYAFTDEERDERIREGIAAGKPDPRKHERVQRFKGLGEMDAKELWETTMDPATRLFHRVTVDDAALADELFTILMGEEVEARKDFIAKGAAEFDPRFLDI
jgi:DNA gyrase subunit B